MSIQQLLASYGGAPAGPVYATWNPSDTNANITLSGSNLVATRGAAANAFYSSRATISKNSGKWYFEVTRTGSSDKTHIIAGLMVGVTALTQYPGEGSSGVGNQPVNTSDVNRYQGGFLTTVTGQSDVGIGGGFQIAVDMGSLGVWVKTFGASGWMGGGDPAAGTSPTYTLGSVTPVFPAVGLFSSGTEVTANFGASTFTGTVPSGFNAGWYT